MLSHCRCDIVFYIGTKTRKFNSYEGLFANYLECWSLFQQRYVEFYSRDREPEPYAQMRNYFKSEQLKFGARPFFVGGGRSKV